MAAFRRYLLKRFIKSQPSLLHQYLRLKQRIEDKTPKLLELQFYDETKPKDRLKVLSLLSHEHNITIAWNNIEDMDKLSSYKKRFGLRKMTYVCDTEIALSPAKTASEGRVALLINERVDPYWAQAYPLIQLYGYKKGKEENYAE